MTISAIWKYPLAIGMNALAMPAGATALDIQMQNGQPMLWALVQPESFDEVRHFQVIGTGQLFNSERMSYVATIQQLQFVWHVFELRAAPVPTP